MTVGNLLLNSILRLLDLLARLSPELPGAPALSAVNRKRQERPDITR